MKTIDQIIQADCLSGLKQLKEQSVQCCVTSPPYWRMRNYGVAGQLGMEATPELYVAALVAILDEVKRVLKPDGTLWLNLGDCYWGSHKSGNNTGMYNEGPLDFGRPRPVARRGLPTSGKHPFIKAKDLVGIPWMVAFALRKQGWYLRQDIIWQKPNPLPESVTDRCVRAHEYIFLFSRSKAYYFDYKAIRTPAKGKTIHDRTSRVSTKCSRDKRINGFRKARGPYEMANRRSVWSITTKSYKGLHAAVFPPELPELCILAGSRKGDLVLDPFMGAGTTALAASRLGRHYTGFELNPGYIREANARIAAERQNEQHGSGKLLRA